LLTAGSLQTATASVTPATLNYAESSATAPNNCTNVAIWWSYAGSAVTTTPWLTKAQKASCGEAIQTSTSQTMTRSRYFMTHSTSPPSPADPQTSEPPLQLSARSTHAPATAHATYRTSRSSSPPHPGRPTPGSPAYSRFNANTRIATVHSPPASWYPSSATQPAGQPPSPTRSPTWARYHPVPRRSSPHKRNYGRTTLRHHRSLRGQLLTPMASTHSSGRSRSHDAIHHTT
jgi:hypothetical protein